MVDCHDDDDCHDGDDDDQAGKQWSAVHQGAWNAQTHCMRSSIIRQVMTNINIIIVIIYHIMIITLYQLAIGRALGILQGCQPGWAGFQLNLKTKNQKRNVFSSHKNVGRIVSSLCLWWPAEDSLIRIVRFLGVKTTKSKIVADTGDLSQNMMIL